MLAPLVGRSGATYHAIRVSDCSVGVLLDGSMDLFRGSSDRVWLRFQVSNSARMYVLVPHNYGIGNRLLNRRDDKKKSSTCNGL